MNIVKSKPTVYMAGKIDANDWRHKLVPGLSRACDRRPINILSLDCGTFTYRGPFFIADGHGGTHGPACHGNCEGQSGKTPIIKPQLFRRNNHAIQEADFLFAYITAYDCIGTICEITYAWGLGKKIFLCFAPDIDQEEFWYPCQMVSIIETVAEDDLQAAFQRVLAYWRAIR